ncbi:aKG-HExxH-type peptide beta-hydroxylase [Piscibacillus sp. B03]|uniref:aKG-HExxH-type peptide beta-hydroxylase n=1 Tax=Piscibacillus sp. B03 TaxID=3457430 RepID=UPI003FCCF942
MALKNLVSNSYQSSFLAILIQMKRIPEINYKEVNQLEYLFKLLSKIPIEKSKDLFYWPISIYAFRSGYKWFSLGKYDKAIDYFSYAFKSIIIYPLYSNGVDFKIDFTPKPSGDWDLNGLGGTIGISGGFSSINHNRFTLTPEILEEIICNKNPFYEFYENGTIAKSDILIKDKNILLISLLNEKLQTGEFSDSDFTNVITSTNQKLLEQLANASDLTNYIWDEGFKEINIFTKTIVPYYTTVHQALAFSVDSCLGCQFTSPVFNMDLIFAEQILHENCHNKLSSIMVVSALLEDKPQNNMEVYHHPWRPDPRPIIGVLHATYVNIIVAEFYKKAEQRLSGESKLKAEERLTTLIREIPLALEELDKNAYFTNSGQKLFEAMVRAFSKI